MPKGTVYWLEDATAKQASSPFISNRPSSSSSYPLRKVIILDPSNTSVKIMVGPSLNTRKPATKANIKFMCSYGGKILPRYPDGKLRYQGGETRVLAVERSISFAELLVKLGEMCGTSVSLRCQLPSEDLDALVSITSDEDLANLIEEYDRAANPTSSLKIRAFLSLPKKASPSPTPSFASSSSNEAISPKSFCSTGASVSSSRCPTSPSPSDQRCIRQMSSRPLLPYPVCYNQKAVRKLPQYANYHCHRNTSHIYLIHNGNHWQ